MNNENIIKVDKKIETICCDGGQDGLGHPAVYYNFDENEQIVCSYCNKKYLREKKDEE